MKKRIIAAILLMITVLFNMTTVFAFSDDDRDYIPSSGYYVVDYADIINYDTATYVVDLNEALSDYSESMRIVVVADYYMKDPYTDAQQIIDDYGVGGPDAVNGMVLYFTTKDDDVLLFTGKTVSNKFSQETANEYIDNYFRKYSENDDYSTAITTLLNELHKWYEDNFNINIRVVEDRYSPGYAIKDGPLYRWDVPSTYLPLVLFVGGFIGIGVYLGLQSRTHRQYYYDTGYSDNNNYNDDFYSHGSSFSGGHHRSSSGRSGGFSSRGRGGGGRGSGGGAGRR